MRDAKEELTTSSWVPSIVQRYRNTISLFRLSIEGAHFLIDVKCGIIMDVEASRAIRQAEVGASQTMIERTEARFGIKPEWLAADTAYGAAPNLDWLVNTQGLPRMFRSSTNRHARMAHFRARSSSTMSRRIATYVRQA